jgi:hypothetical protein
MGGIPSKTSWWAVADAVAGADVALPASVEEVEFPSKHADDEAARSTRIIHRIVIPRHPFEAI